MSNTKEKFPEKQFFIISRPSEPNVESFLYERVPTGRFFNTQEISATEHRKYYRITVEGTEEELHNLGKKLARTYEFAYELTLLDE